MQQAKREAVQMAEKYADLKTVDQFYWFNRDKTYFTVTGESNSGEANYCDRSRIGGKNPRS